MSHIHKKLGTAGFIISIVALVAALGGGAYAASGGLTGKQKKEVTKIAQTEAKKYAGKPGVTGPQGPAGPAGAKGDTGGKGDNGAAGAAGVAGVSVTSTNIPQSSAECSHQGGTKITSASGTSEVCNGAQGDPGDPGAPGSPWVDGGTLPSGATEAGTFSGGPTNPEVTPGNAEEEVTQFRVPISFTIPLASDVAVHVLPLPAAASQQEKDAAAAACPGSNENPIATPGNLCLYTFNSFGTELASVQDPENPGEETAGKVGALLRFEVTQPAGFVRGDWAVTAP
jgi:hypothetical protein